MIMLSKSPQSFPIRYQSERGSQLTNKANPFRDKKFSVDVKGSNNLETGSHNLNQKRGSVQATSPQPQMKAAKPAKEHQTAEKQRAISLQNSLKRNHQSISDTNNIPPQRLNQIVRNVNYISKQLLADLQVTEETK